MFSFPPHLNPLLKERKEKLNMKPKIAIIRGKFLNQYEMQSYEPLIPFYDITAFGSMTSFHTSFAFPTVKLFSPLDLPDFPYKTQLLNRLFHDAQYLFELESDLQGFDIAHSAETYFHFTHQCLRAKQKGYVKKVVVTVWENIPFNNEGISGRREMKQNVIKNADHFIAVSERAKNALVLEGADASKISIVSPGIDTTVFSPGEEANKKHKEIRLLFVGRLVKNKGVYEFLYAMKMLSLDKALSSFQFHLRIIGSGPERNGMQQVAKTLGVADKITYKDVSYADMPNEYKHADIFVAPSKADMYWQEQWGMALMEAQAAGLPIVTTMIGSIPENVGDAALLVQPGDVVSLQEALKQFILNPNMRLEYAKRARERAINVHDVAIVSRKIKEVYERVLKE